MISFWWAYPYTFLVTIPLVFFATLYKYYHYKNSTFTHSLSSWYALKNTSEKKWILHGMRLLRFITLCALACLIARFQKVDHRNETMVDGIDIVLCLDVSGSMDLFDDLHDRRSRIIVAKQEALRFIDQRIHDPMGIVVFGADALTLCPLTLDKQLLKNFIGNTNIGIVNSNGTKLFTGLATAINRLKTSTAKSKMILLLTDGKPMGETQFDSESIIALAQEFNIKIYSVGIGNQQGGYGIDQFGMIQSIGAEAVDYILLAHLASKTGGKFFPAHNPQEMKKAYESINRLEKTTYQTSMLHLYYELFYPFLWILIASLFLELLLRCFVWKGLFS